MRNKQKDADMVSLDKYKPEILIPLRKIGDDKRCYTSRLFKVLVVSLIRKGIRSHAARFLRFPPKVVRDGRIRQ